MNFIMGDQFLVQNWEASFSLMACASFEAERGKKKYVFILKSLKSRNEFPSVI